MGMPELHYCFCVEPDPLPYIFIVLINYKILFYKEYDISGTLVDLFNLWIIFLLISTVWSVERADF